MRVTLTEPSREGTWVAATDHKGLDLVVWVNGAEEVGKIGKSLLRVESCEVLEFPGVGGLRITVETMLEHHESSVVCSTDHEWVKAGVGHAASVFTTDVNEDGAGAVPVLVTDPVSLGVLAIIEVVKVVHLVHKRLLFEHAQVD